MDVGGVGADGPCDGGRLHRHAAGRGQRAQLRAGQPGGGTGFMGDDVAVVRQNDLLTARGPHRQRDLVAHGAAGHKQRRLFACYFRGQPLKAVDRGVVTVNIVADWRRSHGLTHRRCGMGDGVAAQIDDAVLHNQNPPLLLVVCYRV